MKKILSSPYSRLFRPEQWMKSLFVFIGVFYAASWYALPKAILAALCFGLVAGGVYIYNDLLDKERDKNHPTKRLRPIASGQIGVGEALGVMLLVLLLGLLLSLILSKTLCLILAVYLAINITYNHVLKLIPVVDVLCIASGFMLRILAGSIGIGIPISIWLVVSGALISLLIALSKRRLEKQMTGVLETRVVLKQYTLVMLDSAVRMTASATLVSYLMYVLVVHEDNTLFLLTLPFAAIGIFRLIRLISKDSLTDDPVEILWQDTLSRVNLLCFVTVTFLALMLS